MWLNVLLIELDRVFLRIVDSSQIVDSIVFVKCLTCLDHDRLLSTKTLKSLSFLIVCNELMFYLII